MSALLILLAFADVSVAAPRIGSGDEVARVHIQSGWVGLGTPGTIVIEIVRTTRGFSDGTRAIDAALVEALRQRLRARPVATLPAALTTHYQSHWTDDYPEVEVTVTLRSRRVVRATTRDQHDYMLPWIVDGKTTFDMELSSIVAALLPHDAINRARLEGASLRSRSSRP